MGLRGCGKSTLARELAARTGRESIDLDDVTKSYLGAGTISELFEKFGEARFRGAEYRALVNQAVTGARVGPIVALGGGTPTAPGAADFLRDAKSREIAVLVYLRAKPETLRDRLADADNADRPSLTGGNVLEEIEGVFAARDPLYEELADCVIEIDGLSVDEVAAAILTALQ